MGRPNNKTLQKLDALQPQVIEVGGVKFIKISVHNRKIIIQKWVAEREQIERVISKISREISTTGNYSVKASFVSLRTELRNSVKEIGRRVAREGGNYDAIDL